METQIHLIEQEAYSSILRAFKAQSDAITWDKRVKELYNRLPTPNELHVLGEEGVRIEVILVDFQKAKKLAMLKQLITTLVSGSNPASVIKKIAGTVSDFYKRPTLESPSKLALEENAFLFENHGAQLLVQIKRGCCRAPAILFKVLADTLGLESRLVVGLPNDGTVDCMDSNKHMSVIKRAIQDPRRDASCCYSHHHPLGNFFP